MGLISPAYGTIFWMVLSFGLVFFILAKFAWGPILKGLKGREESIEEALQAAENARKEMAALKADHEKIMTEARAERDVLMVEARKMRDEMLEAARSEAVKEGEKMLENARKLIESEKVSAIGEIKEQISVLSVQVAEKILRKELSDNTKRDALMNDMLKDLKLN
ncbi:MAG: F0F1 ATP synthase subunit B [Bacteroidales bacterium]|nr:F0F1 ATP synthase subunit B [Bacteroidales bacterium]